MTTEAAGAANGKGSVAGKKEALTKAVRRAVYEAASGHCHVCDDKKEALASDWHVITDAPRSAPELPANGEGTTLSPLTSLYIVCTDCKRQLGAGTLEQLRVELPRRIAVARALVARYGGLLLDAPASVPADAAEAEQAPRITFAGEARAEASASKSAPKPRGGRGGRAGAPRSTAAVQTPPPDPPPDSGAAATAIA